VLGRLLAAFVTGAGFAGAVDPGPGPLEVVVDTSRVRAKVNPRALGVNLDYLVDDDRNRPAGSRPLVAALKELGVRVLRYPGGDKSDSYLWSRPPYDRADPAPAVSGDWDWPAMDKSLMMPDRRTWKTHPLDFDAFMMMARSAGAEASIVVAVDSGFQIADAHHEAVPMDRLIRTAAEWVRYAKAKGFPVRCWEIGNESNTQVGARRYAETALAFAKAMKAADPEARLGAVGEWGENVGGKDREAGLKEPWNRVVLETAGPYLDYLIVHDYPNWGWKSYAGYLDRDPDFTGAIRGTGAAVRRWAPEKDRGRIRVALTEYGAIDYMKGSWANVSDLGHALLLANMIGQYLGEPSLDFATMWNTRWAKPQEPTAVHDVLDPVNGLTPTGMALAIWARCLGEEMLEVADGRLLKVFATHTPGTGALRVVLINKGMSSHRLGLEVKGGGSRKGERWLLSGSGPDDLAPTWTRTGAAVLDGGRLPLVLPPVSLTAVLL